MIKKSCNGITHNVCNTRLKKEGEKARCCFCDPHEECDFDKKKKIKLNLELDIKPLSVNIAWQGRRFKSKEYKIFEAQLLGTKRNAGLLFYYKAYYGKILKKFIKLEYIFYVKSIMQGDIDNFIKPITDCLVKCGIIPDDRYVIELVAKKIKSDKEKIQISIEEV